MTQSAQHTSLHEVDFWHFYTRALRGISYNARRVDAVQEQSGAAWGRAACPQVTKWAPRHERSSPKRELSEVEMKIFIHQKW